MSDTSTKDLAERHDLKVWQMFYDALAEGRKPFEVRRNDRSFSVGDTLRLREWDNYGEGGYTGRECERRITYVLSGDEVVDFGVQRGFVVLGLSEVESGSEGVTDAERAEIIRFLRIARVCEHPDGHEACGGLQPAIMEVAAQRIESDGKALASAAKAEARCKDYERRIGKARLLLQALDAVESAELDRILEGDTPSSERAEEGGNA